MPQARGRLALAGFSLLKSLLLWPRNAFAPLTSIV